MMKFGKARIIGILLALSLILASIPVVSFADASETVVEEGPGSGEQTVVEESIDSGGNGNETVVEEVPSPSEPNNAGASEAHTETPSEAPSGDQSTGAQGDGGVVFEAPRATGSTFGLPISADELEAAKASFVVDPIRVPDDGVVASGNKAIVRLYLFNTQVSSTATVDPAKIRIAFTIDALPTGAAVKVVDNAYYNYTVTPQGDQTLVVLEFKAFPATGEGITISPLEIATAAGVSVHGFQIPITMQTFYGTETLQDDIPILFGSSATLFGWTNANNTAATASIAANSKSNGFINNSATAVGTSSSNMSIQYNLTNSNASLGSHLGKLYTEKIVVEDTILVDPLIKLTPAALNAFTLTASGMYTTSKSATVSVLETYGDGTVKSFKITYTVNNATLAGASPADFPNSSGTVMQFNITGAKIDVDAALARITTGTYVDLTGMFKSTNLKAAFTPYAGTQAQNLETVAPAYTQTIRFHRIDDVVIPVEDPLSSSGILNKVTEIKGVDDAIKIRGDNSFVYPGEQVTYQISNFGNKLSTTPLDNFMVQSIINQNDMYPTSVNTGRYSTSFQVASSGSSSSYYDFYIMADDGTGEKPYYHARQSYSGNTTINLLTQKGNVSAGGVFYNVLPDLTQITRIVWDFGHLSSTNGAGKGPGTGVDQRVPAAFTRYTNDTYWPYVVTRVKDRETTGQGDTVLNTANVAYSNTVDGVTIQYPSDSMPESAKAGYLSEATLGYYHQEEDENGFAKGLNKDAVKLWGASASSSSIATGDLIEYTVTFRNAWNHRVGNPFIDDTFYGLTPYVADPNNYLSHYGTAPFIKLISIKDKNGTNVTSTRGVTYDRYVIGPDHKSDANYYNMEPELTSNMWRIRLNGILEPGDVVQVSYVMKVTATDMSTVRNEFRVHAYPTESGGPYLYDLGSGSHEGITDDGGGGGFKVYQPTITYKMDVTRPDGVTPYVVANGAEKDELLTVKLTLSNATTGNDAPRTFPLVTYGMASRLYPYMTTYYQDVLKMTTAGTYSYYGSNAVLKESALSANFELLPNFNKDASGNAYYKEAGMFYLKKSGSAYPVSLTAGESLVLEFKISVEEWRQTKSYNYEPHYVYAMLRDKSNEYILSSSTSWGASQTKYDDTVKNEAPAANIDGLNETQSYIRNYRNVFIAKENDPVVEGMARGNHSISVGNAASVASQNFYYPYIYNRSETETLYIDKIYHKLPKYLSFHSFYGSSDTGTGGWNTPRLVGVVDGRKIYEFTRKNGQPLALAPGYSGYPLDTRSYVTNEDLELMREENPAPAGHNAATQKITDQFTMATYSKNHAVIASDPNSSTSITTLDETARQTGWGGSAMLGISMTEGTMVEQAVSSTFTYTLYHPQPSIKVEALKRAGGIYESVGTSAIAPGDDVGWLVTVTHTSGYRYSINNPVAVVQLPGGMTYNRQDEMVSGITGFNVTQDSTSGALLIPLGDMVAGNTRSFIIGATAGVSYGEKIATANLVLRDPFYTVGSPATRVAFSTLPSDLDFGGPVFNTYAARATGKVEIKGELAFTTDKKVRLPNGSFVQQVNDVERDVAYFDYQLTLKNESAANIPYQGVTIIDRLPAPNDFLNWEAGRRGSNTKVMPVSSTPISVTKNGTALEAGTGYKLSYSSVGAQHVFGEKDYNLSESGPDAGWTPVSAWNEIPETATAFRVELANELPMKESVEITYRAKPDSSVAIPPQSATAVNTFAAGFTATLGQRVIKAKPECAPAIINYVDRPPAIIKGKVFLDKDYDGVYNGADVGYTEDPIAIELVNATTDVVYDTQSINPTGDYSFEVMDIASYYVRFRTLPRNTYDLYDKIVMSEQGNKFKVVDTVWRTESFAVQILTEYTCNASIVPKVEGELTITKNLSAGSAAAIGTVTQKFIFRIDCIPEGGTAADMKTFYEVIQGAGQSRTITGLPRGTYTVTEIAGWATEFESADNGAKDSSGNPIVGNLKITYTSDEISATFTNRRTEANFFHAIANALNKFGNLKAVSKPVKA